MNYRLVGSLVAAAAIAFAQPVVYIAQEVNKAAEIIAAARKAIGGGKLDVLKTFSLDASVERNLSNMRMASDVEIVLDLPDKYLRQDTPSGGGGGMMIIAGALLGGTFGGWALHAAAGPPDRRAPLTAAGLALPYVLAIAWPVDARSAVRGSAG